MSGTFDPLFTSAPNTGASGQVVTLTVPVALEPFEAVLASIYGDAFCPDGGYIAEIDVDQWWRVYLACECGEEPGWVGVSDGPTDIRHAFERAIVKARAAHASVGGSEDEETPNADE